MLCQVHFARDFLFSYTYGKIRSDYSESIQVGKLTRKDEECSANTLTAIAVIRITINFVFSVHSTKNTRVKPGSVQPKTMARLNESESE